MTEKYGWAMCDGPFPNDCCESKQECDSVPVLNARYVAWAKMKIKEASHPFNYEQTPAGAQGIISGADPVPTSELAKKRMGEPLKPAKPQLPCDVGLFSDEHLQMDLVEFLQDPTND